MIQTHHCKQWDEQEVYQLFAERLPVIPMPGNFAIQLVQSVLEEVTYYGTLPRDEQTSSPESGYIHRPQRPPSSTA